MMIIIKPGLLTTVQDLGRYGFQKNGVTTSGAMDPFSHRIANLLVGNEDMASTLEATLIGPSLKFQEDSLIAICGGDFSPKINGEQVKMWRPIFIKKGSTLHIGQAVKGSRAYLAVAGGFQVPSIMGSKSTYLRGKLGGFYGRSLLAGDSLPIGPLSKLSQRMLQHFVKMGTSRSFAEANWSISADFLPRYQANPTIRVMKGRHFQWFNQESKTVFFNEPYKVTPESDRMGYRLKGSPLNLTEPIEVLSEAVNFGTIQVPSDGNPIVLLADCQTVGGYPKIAQLASVDFPLIAQSKPGSTIRFHEITYKEAQLLYLEREKLIQEFKLGMKLKFR